MTQATAEQLSLCPGLGDVKVKRLYDAFNLPFRVGNKPRPSSSIPKNLSKNATSSRARKETTPASGQRTLAEMTGESSARARSQSRAPIDIDNDIPQASVLDDVPQPTPVYSPDWPDEDLEPEPQNLAAAKQSETLNQATAGAWKDALESDEDEDEVGDEPAAKRIRT